MGFQTHTRTHLFRLKTHTHVSLSVSRQTTWSVAQCTLALANHALFSHSFLACLCLHLQFYACSRCCPAYTIAFTCVFALLSFLDFLLLSHVQRAVSCCKSTRSGRRTLARTPQPDKTQCCQPRRRLTRSVIPLLILFLVLFIECTQ